MTEVYLVQIQKKKKKYKITISKKHLIMTFEI